MTNDTLSSTATERFGFHNQIGNREELAEPEITDRSMRSLLMLMSHEREQNGVTY